jgi:hypothetical protein
VKLPAAPTNRPVPPVITACSTIAKTGVLVSAVRKVGDQAIALIQAPAEAIEPLNRHRPTLPTGPHSVLHPASIRRSTN